MDSARNWTDRQLEKMEEQISEIYRKSAHDIYKNWDAYMERAAKRVETYEKDLRDAQKVGDDKIIAQMETRLQNAKMNVTLRNDHFRGMLDAVTEQLAKTNETALNYINGEIPKIYTKNYNQAAETAGSVGVKFNLINERTVKHMILNGEEHMDSLRKRLNKPKDKRWNAKQIVSTLTQGIIQGESIPKISKKIFHSLEGNGPKDITRKNKVAAIRNARTMVTGAENRGRLDSYKQIQDEGMILHKVWMATPDGRTRDWHIDMDGQEVPVDEMFIDGLGNELEYPGDPGGAPESVYNCRCTMVTNVVGFRREDGSVSVIEYEDEGGTLHEQQMEQERTRRSETKLNKGIKTGQAQSANDPYSQERKDNALWAKSEREYDNAMRSTAGETWRNASGNEKQAIYGYTRNSDPYNMPLRGCDGSWRNYVGTENMSVSKRAAKLIDDTTRYIEKSILPQDTWLQRGVSENGAARFLGIPSDLFYKASAEEMAQVVIGKVVSDDAFFSCGSSKGSGFDGVVFNIYAPEGTQAAYVEPFSHYGAGEKLNWNGISEQQWFGSELETLLQRGTEFNVVKVEKNDWDEWFFDIEVVNQNPRPLDEMFDKIGKSY